jgi:hypothetical protein
MSKKVIMFGLDCRVTSTCLVKVQACGVGAQCRGDGYCFMRTVWRGASSVVGVDLRDILHYRSLTW